MNLITATVRPSTWEDVGGPGSISPFRTASTSTPTACCVARWTPEATGLAMARLEALKRSNGNQDSARTSADAQGLADPAGKARAACLGRGPHAQRGHAAPGRAGKNQVCAGLSRNGRPGAWPVRPALGTPTPKAGTSAPPAAAPYCSSTTSSCSSRYLSSSPQGTFGCSIDPTEEGLARTKRFAEQSAAQPIKPEQRNAWLKQLRDQMGRQID